MKFHKKHSHSGIHSIDYYAYTSKLRDWNAVYKVIVAFIILVLCIVLDNIWVSLFIIITMGMVTVGMGKIELHSYLTLLMIPIVFMILGSIAIAVGVGKVPVGKYAIHLHWFYLYITPEGVLKALAVTLKALGAVSAMYMLTLSTPTSEIIMVLRKLKVPKIIIELMNMIYRFIFILMEAQCQMHHTVESRLGYIDFKTSIYSFGNMASNLLLVSLKKSNAYYDALVSRGYEGELLFLEEQKPCGLIQVSMAVVYIIILLIMALLLS